MCIEGLTFDFVGCSSTDFSFTVLKEILESWNQVVLGDLWPDCFLELDSKIKTIYYLNFKMRI